jgi:hypothetical protein
MSTLLEMRDEVKADLDLEDATFGEDVSISDADIDRWINLGIRKAERIILGLYEDYFISYVAIPITSGDNKIDYPSDIYGNKIRKIVYDSGTGQEVFEVKRIKDIMSATAFDLLNTAVTQPILRWFPVNDGTDGRKIQLFPSTSRDGTLHVWYIRNAKQLSDDSDVTDIDEFAEFITVYAKLKAAIKDQHPLASDYKVMLTELEDDLKSTLAGMVLDEDDYIPVDTEFYEDSN